MLIGRASTARLKPKTPRYWDRCGPRRNARWRKLATGWLLQIAAGVYASGAAFHLLRICRVDTYARFVPPHRREGRLLVPRRCSGGRAQARLAGGAGCRYRGAAPGPGRRAARYPRRILRRDRARPRGAETAERSAQTGGSAGGGGGG